MAEQQNSDEPVNSPGGSVQDKPGSSSPSPDASQTSPEAEHGAENTGEPVRKAVHFVDETPEQKRKRNANMDYIKHYLELAGQKVLLPVAQLVQCIQEVKVILRTEPSLLELTGAVTVCGDLHGNTLCLSKLLAIGDLPWHTRWLFLGNYINRGPWSIELLAMVVALKRVYPNHVYLLRGNHDQAAMAKVYGFKNMFLQERKYSEEAYKEVLELFDLMPLAATINGKVFCCHGGLSPSLLRTNGLDIIRKIKRPTLVPERGLVTDLLWACPRKERGWARAPNLISKYFGPDVISEFCDKNGIELIVRGMQVVKLGYLYYPTARMLTIHSTNNAVDNMRNDAAIVAFDNKLQYVIKKYNTQEENPISTQDLLTEDTTITTTTNTEYN